MSSSVSRLLTKCEKSGVKNSYSLSTLFLLSSTLRGSYLKSGIQTASLKRMAHTYLFITESLVRALQEAQTKNATLIQVAFFIVQLFDPHFGDSRW